MRVYRSIVLVIVVLAATSSRFVVGTANAGEPLVNDECADAIAIDAIPFTADASVEESTHDATDPASSCEVDPAPPSVWYRLELAGNPGDQRQVVLSTLESDYGAVLTVFTGTCDALTEVACGGPSVGDLPRSRLAFTATVGTSYLVMVTSTGSAASPDDELRLSVDVYDAFPGGKEAKKVVACQDAVTHSGGRFMATALGATAKCVDGLFKCVQTGAGDPTCAPKACARCEHAIGNLAEGQAILVGVTKKCAADRVPFSHVLGSAAGLGFESFTEGCEDLTGDPLTDVDALAQCLADSHVCAAAETFDRIAPRGRELLTELCGSVPPELECFGDPTSGGSVALDQGKPITKCAAAIEKAGAKFAVIQLKARQRCVDRVFTCLQTKPADDACAVATETTCTDDLAPIAVARGKLLAAIDAKCGDIPFAVLRGADGLGLEHIAEACTNIGAPLDSLADYGECIARRTTCTIESLVLTETPLAQTYFRVADQPQLFRFCN